MSGLKNVEKKLLSVNEGMGGEPVVVLKANDQSELATTHYRLGKLISIVSTKLNIKH